MSTDGLSEARERGPADPVRSLLGWSLDWIGLGANLIGAVVVFVFIIFLSPGTLSDEEFDRVLPRNLPLFVVYMAITLPLGRYTVQVRPLRPIRRWLAESRAATAQERAALLRYPLNWALSSAVFWVGAAILFGIVNSDFGASATIVVMATALLGGLTACALQYLLVEREIRPLTALALAGGPPPPGSTPGVRVRLTMAWVLATGVPLLGAVSFALADLLGADLDREQVVASILFLCMLAIATGFAAMWFSSRSVSEPLETMRGALEQVESGDLGGRLGVEDGSEVGMLQAGFNRMVAGLAERERLRDAFGAFVDPGLTERVLAEGTDLAGEEVELSILFMDVRGFTSYSEHADAREVVATLNRLYALVVPVILRHGGHANKFIGDGLLAVFGAPERLSDHADRAVAAALELSQEVAAGFDGGLRVGVGINSGAVVAGTIGGGGRVDFTVIGDTVNTAARVESATRATGDDILITDATRARLTSVREWIERPAIELKGKREPVRLFAPA